MYAIYPPEMLGNGTNGIATSSTHSVRFEKQTRSCANAYTDTSSYHDHVHMDCRNNELCMLADFRPSALQGTLLTQ